MLKSPHLSHRASPFDGGAHVVPEYTALILEASKFSAILASHYYLGGGSFRIFSRLPLRRGASIAGKRAILPPIGVWR